MLYKRIRYVEISFCDAFYLAGTNILQDSAARTYLKNKNLLLTDYGKAYPHLKIKNGKMYRLSFSGKKFRVCIAEPMPYIYLIGYPSRRDLQIRNVVQDAESEEKNRQALYRHALHILSSNGFEEEYMLIYSEDRSHRLKIKFDIGCIEAIRQRFVFNPDAQITLPDFDSDPYRHLGWYEDEGVSFYDDLDRAIKDFFGHFPQ